jgi:cob(I)alamin adenosyltransferase
MNRIQVYTGDGKGKTTAALGLAIRHLGAGGRVCLIHFDKGARPGFEDRLYSERSLLKGLPGLELHGCGTQRFDPDQGTFRFENTPEDRQEALRGLALAEKALDQKHSLLILDEVLSLVMTKLVKTQEVMDFVKLYLDKGRPCELVLTGHAAWPELAACADLITDMRKRKHYFDIGESARKGIEF